MKQKVIEEGNKFYNGLPTDISDAVYDGLLEMIHEVEPRFNIYEHIKYNNDGVRAKHTILFRDYDKVADIDKFKTEQSFKELTSKYHVLPKLDGCSTVTYYKEGLLDKIITRSDDETGIVNTEKLKNKVAIRAPLDNCIAMLGEAICDKKDGFNRSKSNGLVNSKDMQDEVDKYLYIVPFDYYLSDGTKVPNLDIAITDYSVFKKLVDTGTFTDPISGRTYECDGIVNYPIKVSDEKLDIHKFYYTQKLDSTLLDVKWYPADNSGILQPTASYKPLDFNGREFSAANLFNYQYIIDHNIRPGMPIKVIDQNVTIPALHEDTWELPENSSEEAKEECAKYVASIRCPSCGGPVRRYGGTGIVCDNSVCNWWMKFISYRILQNYDNFNDETYEMVYSDDQSKCDFMREFITDEMAIDIRTNMTKLLSIVSIPRFNQNKIELIKQAYESQGDGDVLKAVGMYTTDLQYEYFELMYDRILNLLSIIGK